MMLRYFTTATPAYTIDADGEAESELDQFDTITDHRTGSALMVCLSVGVRHTDIDDACDPTTMTRVMQATGDGWAWALGRAMSIAAEGHLPGMSPEQVIKDMLHGLYTPQRCHCAYDCCGHRSGYCDVHHLGGTMFMVQVHTSRNY